MTSSSTARKTVLVAADTPFVRDRFKAALDAAGHRAMIVKSVAQLLAHVRADLAELDLIVLDLRMPHASGVELVRRIRKLDEGHLPILVFSGTVSSVDEVRELAALGVAGYLNEYSAVEHILPSIAPHLFPDTFNRRDSPRVVMGMPVSYRIGNQITAALSLNLSRGGIAIRTSGAAAARHRAEDEVRAARIEEGNGDRRHRLLERAEVGHGHPLHEGEAGRSDRRSTTFVDAHFFRSVKTGS